MKKQNLNVALATNWKKKFILTLKLLKTKIKKWIDRNIWQTNTNYKITKPHY